MQAFPKGLRTALARSRATRRFTLTGTRSAHTTNDPSSPAKVNADTFAPTSSSPSSTTPGPSGNTTTHFGFRTIPEESKETLVRGVFDSVASRYDIMNDAMSLGVHRLWKDSFVSLLRPGSKGPVRCVDVAGGTGDIALRILDYVRETHADRETCVDVVDINSEMLKEGFKRFKKTMYHNSVPSRLSCFPLIADHGSPI